MKLISAVFKICALLLVGGIAIMIAGTALFGNHYEDTPLQRAAARSDKAAVQRLLASGADADDGYHSLTRRLFARPYRTPLYIAASKGDTAIVKLLIGHGADVNARPMEGQLAAHEAARNGHHDVAKLLLEHGCRRYDPEYQAELTPHGYLKTNK